MADKPQEEGKRIMDQGWVQVQKKTFTKWANNHLVKKFGKDVFLAELENDFETGEKLIQLVNALYGHAMPKYNKNPKMRPHKLDNLTVALNFLEKTAGVKTNFLKTTHLADKDLKMILGMIWAIILHFQIQGISVEELSAKEGLLLWCQRKTKGYRDVDPPKIRGFTTDWQNGLAFCALIHKHRPDLINYDSLDKANARENLELAFSVAEKELGIPRLLDVEDVCDVARPDERSVITYVSEYFHCFASQGEAEGAGQRIAALVATARANAALMEQYEHDAAELRAWIAATTEAHRQRDNIGAESLAAAEGAWAALGAHRRDEKPAKTKAKLDLEAQYATLQTKLKVQGRAAYVAPEGSAPAAIDAQWATLTAEETARAAAIAAELRRQRRIKALVDRFTRRADALDAWCAANDSFLSQTDCGADVASTAAHLKTLDGFDADFGAVAPRFAAAAALAAELGELGYADAPAVDARATALTAAKAALDGKAADRRAALEAELARQQRLEELRVDFGTRGRMFANWVEHADLLNEPLAFETVAELDEFATQFGEFRAEVDGAKAAEFAALEALAGECAAAGITSNVYAVYSIDDLTARWTRVRDATAAIPAALDGERKRVAGDDAACVAFADAARAFSAWCETQRAALAAVAGAPAEQLAALAALQAALSADAGRLDALTALNDAVAARNVLSNPHTAADPASLKAEYDGLLAQAGAQIGAIEKELARADEASGLSEAQMEEFRSVFKHFDSDSNNTLEHHEFKACLSGLGYSKSDDECREIMRDVGSDGVIINFDQFAQFMLKQNDTSDTADNMREAFKTVAGGKQQVTEADLRAVLDADTVDYLLSQLAPTDDGLYDFGPFVDSQYA
eukprot:TRINITY_DN206_c0_g1_i8.p2 TRINITY_DN206_c0_g1~~TRINITY_DN206_c0_g1_i8.p2  ORF type:complete len:865 (-),score=590.84 TRINITY_DN206_c0_g1_i8:34-2628(-)